MTPLLVDSHCHLDFPELSGRIDEFLAAMRQNGVGWALVAGVRMDTLNQVLALAERHAGLFAAVGVHPDVEDNDTPDVDTLVASSDHAKVVAIGETGLDYYRLTGDLAWQRERFRTHIEAAKVTGKPLIIHTRDAAADTLQILEETRAGEVGGVFHCFTETTEVAAHAVDLGFHVSLSGIVTFKNAIQIKEVAKFLPLDRLLVETDAPYLAPVPFRGKLNHPALVRHVADEVARLRGIDVAELARATSENFFRLFRIAPHAATV